MSDNTNHRQNNAGQTFVIQQTNNSNGTGVAGFIFAILGLLLGWIPVLGWILWLLGLILSFIGLFKKPNGLAIAGFIISILELFLLIFLFAGLGILMAGKR